MGDLVRRCEHGTAGRVARKVSGDVPRTRLLASTEQPRRVPQWLYRFRHRITATRALGAGHAPSDRLNAQDEGIKPNGTWRMTPWSYAPSANCIDILRDSGSSIPSRRLHRWLHECSAFVWAWPRRHCRQSLPEAVSTSAPTSRITSFTRDAWSPDLEPKHS